MLLTCDQCQKRYNVPDERAAGRLLRVRCKACGFLITAQGPASSPTGSDDEEDGPTRAVTLSEMMRLAAEPAAIGDAAWDSEATRTADGPDPKVHWFAILEGAQEGPLPLPDLLERIHSGRLTLDTYVWRHGRAEWNKAADVPEMVELIGRAPPLQSLFADLDLPAEKAGAEPLEPATGETTLVALFVDRERARRRALLGKVALAAVVVLALAGTVVFVRRGSPATEAQEAAQVPAVSAQPSPRETGPAPARDPRLKDKLLGAAPPTRPPRSRKAAVPPPAASRAPARTAAPQASVGSDLESMVGAKEDVGPRSRRVAAEPAPEEAGRPPKEVVEVVEQARPAFQFCIEQYLRKHPSFRGGKVQLVATVGPSGVVKAATLDRSDIDGTELGSCLKTKAKRMAFSAAEGDDVDLEIPLVLTTTL